MELTWAEILELFGPALWATMIASLVSPLIGCFLLVRRTGFYGIALPQFAAAGVAFGFAVAPWFLRLGLESADVQAGGGAAFGYHLFWAACFTFSALFVLALFRDHESTEIARMAAAFAIASAMTILLAHASPVGDVFVHELLRGEILAVGLVELAVLGVVCAATLVVCLWFEKDLLIVSYDPEMAEVLGKSVLLYVLLLQVATGAIVATAVMVVGPVVVFGLLVIPPLAARSLARSWRSFVNYAVAMGLIAGLAGIVVSFRLDWPLGPSVVGVAALELVPAWLLSRL